MVSENLLGLIYEPSRFYIKYKSENSTCDLFISAFKLIKSSFKTIKNKRFDES